jgi:hypothetical protein
MRMPRDLRPFFLASMVASISLLGMVASATAWVGA